MTVTFKAIPTEYKGIRFDSKSEAVFARLLDLHGIDWEHQHPISHEGHDWDFLVWLPDYISFTAFPNGWGVDGGCSTTGREVVRPCLVELKPSEPTDTYLLRLENGHGSPQNEMRIVAWGNPWAGGVRNTTYECKELLWNKTWNAGKLSWINGFCGFDSSDKTTEAKSYRFDLAHPTGVIPNNYARDVLSNYRPEKEKKASGLLHDHVPQEGRELYQWRNAITSINCMVADYAGLAVAVTPSGVDHWDVAFPPGAERCLAVCDEHHNKATLERAVGECLGIAIRLSFSISKAQQS